MICDNSLKRSSHFFRVMYFTLLYSYPNMYLNKIWMKDYNYTELLADITRYKSVLVTSRGKVAFNTTHFTICANTKIWCIDFLIIPLLILHSLPSEQFIPWTKPEQLFSEQLLLPTGTPLHIKPRKSSVRTRIHIYTKNTSSHLSLEDQIKNTWNLEKQANKQKIIC